MARSLRPYLAFPITTRTLEVRRVADVTPGMRRVTLAGAELAAHTATNGHHVHAFRSDGFDDEFKVLLKHPEAAEAVGPTQADGVLDWPRTDPHLVMRTYTVRRWDPEAGELDVDFVQHGVGPATVWARSVQPGERIQIAGPKSSSPHPEGTDWVLAAGDETALPALGRWLEEDWPSGARGQVFIEIGEDSHRQELAVPDGVELTWLSRDGAEPGTTTLLFDAIRAADWWDGTVFAWVAGEATTLTPIRRWLRRDKGLGKEQVEVTGYWRKQEVVLSEDDPQVQDLDASSDVGDEFHELSELLPPVALRVAVTVGLPDAFGGAPRTLEELTTSTGADSAGLTKLLRYLAAIGAVEIIEDGRWALTPLGAELEEEHIIDQLDLRRFRAQRELAAALALPDAVLGRPDDGRWASAALADRLEHSTDLLTDRLEHESSIAGFLASALAGSHALDERRTVVVGGLAAATFALAVARTRPDARCTVVAAPSTLEVYRGLEPEHDRVALQPGSLLEARDTAADAVLLCEPFLDLPDTDATGVLRAARRSLADQGRVLVFTDVLDELAHDHDLESDLVSFALHGGGVRDQTELAALFDAAGLTISGQETVGWGFTLFELAPTG